LSKGAGMTSRGEVGSGLRRDDGKSAAEALAFHTAEYGSGSLPTLVATRAALRHAAAQHR